MNQRSTPTTKGPLRPNVCILLFNQNSDLFLAERIDIPDHWQFPQGGVEDGHSEHTTVIKELWEEAGIKRELLGEFHRLTASNSYLWSDVPEYAKGKWIGQCQSFWVVEYLGSDNDIDLIAGCGENHVEFSRWCWCPIERIRELAAPIRLKGYEGALEEFLEYLRGRRK
jgi:putative (di)nucleoside polyphosphate hydrolase